MIIRNLDQLLATERDVAWGNGQSRRFLLESDGMGYSLTDTVINAGSESLLQYKHYLRAKTTMRLVCVFSPPLKGNESHNLDGNSESSY